MNTNSFFRHLFLAREAAVTLMQRLYAFADGSAVCLCCGSPCGHIPLCGTCLAQLRRARRPFIAYNAGSARAPCIPADKTDAVLPECVPAALPPEMSAGGVCRARIDERRCSVCGRELVSERRICTGCRTAPVLRHTDGVFPLYSYRLWRKDLLFAWKIEGRRSLSPVFAELAARALREVSVLTGQNVPLVPVPPRPGKIRAQGWDQIDELCRLLHWRFGYELAPLLERVTQTQQKKLSREGRLETLGRSYRIKRPLPAALPETVVLIDDVSTTGVTLETCAAALKEAGIARVYAVVLFCVDS